MWSCWDIAHCRDRCIVSYSHPHSRCISISMSRPIHFCETPASSIRLPQSSEYACSQAIATQQIDAHDYGSSGSIRHLFSTNPPPNTMSAAARPARKRAATSTEDAPGPSKKPQKKTRFVEPQDDPVNFAEEVDANLETRQRRGRVRTEGYDSDSSDDGEGVVPSRRPGADKAEEDEDMFAMGEKEEQKAEESGKKAHKFLRLGDIEGQEFNDQTSDRSGSDEDEPEDEDSLERRKKAGMGFELSSFNMREEMEEGKFAEDGTYVRSFDPHAVHDKWMDGLDEQEIKKARRNHRQREKEQKQKQKAEEEEMRQIGGRPEAEKELAAMLKKGETVLEALQRLGAQAKKNGTVKRTCAMFHVIL